MYIHMHIYIHTYIHIIYMQILMRHLRFVGWFIAEFILFPDFPALFRTSFLHLKVTKKKDVSMASSAISGDFRLYIPLAIKYSTGKSHLCRWSSKKRPPFSLGISLLCLTSWKVPEFSEPFFIATCSSSNMPVWNFTRAQLVKRTSRPDRSLPPCRF